MSAPHSHERTISGIAEEEPRWKSISRLLLSILGGDEPAIEERIPGSSPLMPVAALRADPEAGNLRFPVSPPFSRAARLRSKCGLRTPLTAVLVECVVSRRDRTGCRQTLHRASRLALSRKTKLEARLGVCRGELEPELRIRRDRRRIVGSDIERDRLDPVGE